ncbi:peptidoglycan-binding protein, partial [Nodosilinea sp. AN01ver1]|uniref:peptidoglycan-binding protein n=1 Tax=Nodosilinea sp. AN01ver1 TaxID=3423362 RepID=UPI003D320A1D
MLEGLAYLHCSCIYEQNDETTRISLKPLKGLVGLSLAFCAYITGSQSTEAATTTLQPGDSGAGVEYLKERLRKAWCLPQAITNNDNYDEVTAAAVKSLQRQHGLLMNGVVDEQTAKVIEDGKMCYAPEDSAALKLGDAGEEVRLLKTQLSNWGFPLTGQRLQPTGTFDPTTQVALKEFEDFFGLKPDSILDPLDSALLWKPRQEVLASLLPNLKGAPADILPLIIPLLESQNPDHRKAAIAKLRSRRLYAKEAVPNLTALLQSQDPDDRQNAAGTLGAIGSDAREAVPALITLLESQNQQDRNAAANALGGIGADAKEAVPTLISLLESQHQQDRSAAANALGEIGADAKETVPTLISLL